MIAEPSGVSYFLETHELLLLTRDEYENALLGAGLVDVHFDADVLPRGGFIGKKTTA